MTLHAVLQRAAERHLTAAKQDIPAFMEEVLESFDSRIEEALSNADAALATAREPPPCSCDLSPYLTAEAGRKIADEAIKNFVRHMLAQGAPA